MAWDGSRGPDNPKYRTREHKAYRKRLLRALRLEGGLICTAPDCLYGDRMIVNPNGGEPDGLTAGHADNGVDYVGPQHRLCNSRDGSVRARQRQIEAGKPMRLTPGIVRPRG